MQIVDFTNLPKRNKMYAGANGSKISVIYEGQQYMLKFPPPPTKNKDMSYSNSCFSEYDRLFGPCRHILMHPRTLFANVCNFNHVWVQARRGGCFAEGCLVHAR